MTINHNISIDTKRLHMRHIDESDAAAIYEYSKNPNVGPSAGWKPHESMEETMEVMSNVFLNQKYVFGIVWKPDNKLIGSIGLIADHKRQNSRAKMLGYAIAEDCWGRGIVTEAAQALVSYAFENIAIDIVTAYCYPTNPASRRVLEKTGFHMEGTLRQAEVLFNGTVMDNVCFSITREEWTAQNE